ncbi:uncharacterized protein FOBCDRAFT_194235 [Fusarium oxysporum Fo47]|uniref:uncharacterized protein n=1 Tax=Fusarium oxysporum Fo47 TaxID=660027 RepID=UPI002869A582|nr:uncharacterized protein FOBCDRAFT_194235 [Fusarium oxysporum Fo47]WJG34389.1 hypothetical protein FOBCDRAFT_194235 [Fusarium oxysporum Fo47]
MASTQEGTSKVYAITREGDDFLPENAVWTCKWGPIEAQCGHINDDIRNKKCTKCGFARSASIAHVGKRLDEGVKGRCWEICGIENDGTEVWTYDLFVQEMNFGLYISIIKLPFGRLFR